MKSAENHIKFEILISHLFDSYDIANIENEIIQDDEIDIILEDDERNRCFVEIKLYKSRKISITLIRRAIETLGIRLTKSQVNHGLLIVSCILDKEIRESFEKEYGITIWDRSTLYHLTEYLIKLREELENILTVYSEDRENIFTGIELEFNNFKIGNLWNPKPKLIRKIHNKGKILCRELTKIPAGRGSFKQFELKCEEILKYIFDTDLTAWHHQARTDDGLNQFDLICRIASNHDFWKSLSINFNCRYILFEFKNYTDKIKQGQVYTTEKYLFNKALRSVGFIIAKNGAETNAIKAMKGALREHGKLLICLTPNDLCQMLDKKDNGDDPSSYLADLVDDFLIKLSR